MDPKPTVWPARQRRAARDPEYTQKLSRYQIDSRRRRRDRDWIAHVVEHGDLTCQHQYPAGRRCWRIDEHQHAVNT